MDTEQYCDHVKRELTTWKQKLDKAVTHMDTLTSRVKEKVLPNIEDVHILSAELDERIRQLDTECSLAWQPPTDAVSSGHTDMRGRYTETMKFLGKASPVSIVG